MTPEQVRLVRASFARVVVQGERPAQLFYGRLFALDPSLRALFKGDLAAQRGKFLTALAMVVDALDRLDAMLPAVQALGRRHARYGARSENYATVGSALIWTLEQSLGDHFTLPVRRAWTAAYGLLAWTMITAAEAELREAA
jgi:hemoglobin-like flavoprotein